MSRNKLISLAPRKPRPAPAELPMPTLREFWEALQQTKGGGAGAPASARAGLGHAASSGRPRGSGSRRHGSGSGSGGGGYGVDLVAPADHFSRERILTIMRDLCRRDKSKGEPVS